MSNSNKSFESKPQKQEKKKGNPGGWKNSLLPYITHPNDCDTVIFFDENLVVIPDAYPKAKKHFLILPRKVIENYSMLTREDLPLLKLLKKKGENLVEQEKEKNPSLQFQIGFHAVPSLNDLHMHIISTDFQGSGLKIRKHYLSYATEFFLPIDYVIDVLQKYGTMKIDDKEMAKILDGPLVSHYTGENFENKFKRFQNHLAEEFSRRHTSTALW